MEKIKIVQYGVTHEHAAGKIASLRKLTDIFEIVGVIDDRASTAARFPQEVDMSLYEGLNNEQCHSFDPSSRQSALQAAFVCPLSQYIPHIFFVPIYGALIFH